MAAPPPPPLEDSFAEILLKAATGQGFDPAFLGKLAEGVWDPLMAQTACQRLGLSFPALADIAEGRWQPDLLSLPDGLAMFTTPFGQMTVNAYLAWDTAAHVAAAFDTGGDAAPLLDELLRRGLTLRFLFLTHTHGDHVFEVDRLVEKTGCEVLAPEAEPWAGGESIRAGETRTLGHLTIEARSTPGHSPGGTTYVLHGLSAPVAVVGDALFAGSIGRVRAHYPQALAIIRQEILTRQDHTLLCPGHGPLTTVGWERQHNPFFSERSCGVT